MQVQGKANNACNSTSLDCPNSLPEPEGSFSTQGSGHGAGVLAFPAPSQGIVHTPGTCSPVHTSDKLLQLPHAGPGFKMLHTWLPVGTDVDVELGLVPLGVHQARLAGQDEGAQPDGVDLGAGGAGQGFSLHRGRPEEGCRAPPPPRARPRPAGSRGCRCGRCAGPAAGTSWAPACPAPRGAAHTACAASRPGSASAGRSWEAPSNQRGSGRWGCCRRG